MPDILTHVAEYYSAAITKHGPKPLGVDWPSTASQYLRFVQLLKLCGSREIFSLNDFGCGYGGLLAFLAEWQPNKLVSYCGIDVSQQMIDVAGALWKRKPNVEFHVGSKCPKLADYTVASGVFNVALGRQVDEWEKYIELTLLELFRSSKFGFGVNFMLPLEVGDREGQLYRTIPERWEEFCRNSLGCTTERLANYGLREFTLLVRARGS